MKYSKIILIFFITLSLSFCATTQNKKTEDNDKTPQYHYERAVVAMQYNLIEQTINYLNTALTLDPEHQESYYLLGAAYSKLQKFPEAASAFEKYAEFRPDFSEAQNVLGAVYQKMEQMDKAEVQFQKAFAIDNNPDASFNLANLYLGQEKLEPALDYVRKSIQKRENSAASFNLQGVILNKMSRFPDAINSFQAALRIDPSLITTGINLSVSYINNKEIDKARTLLEKLLLQTEDLTLKDKIKEILTIIKDREI